MTDNGSVTDNDNDTDYGNEKDNDIDIKIDSDDENDSDNDSDTETDTDRLTSIDTSRRDPCVSAFVSVHLQTCLQMDSVCKDT